MYDIIDMYIKNLLRFAGKFQIQIQRL